ncbi:Spo0E family sporulation regulatory protein-aspartic acid phosphatase [Niallia circulans]|uniref:Spo0E family sporulation regulatory protein-aspartic acid phosphatase n=1 Tax=Niallia circulans TaxID=1397 RepID=UPI00399CD4F3
MLKKQLLTQIELKRTELIEIAMKHGFSSSSAIICSQELDVLLNKYNEINLKNEFPAFRESKKTMEYVKEKETKKPKFIAKLANFGLILYC